VSSRLLLATRQDKVLLAWAAPDKPQTTLQRLAAAGKAEPPEVVAKRMLDNFSDILFGYHLHGVKKMLDGSYTDAGPSWADAEHAHIMALHVRYVLS
jgi:hypothetical protein